jgi:hypothetical protein
MEPTIRDLVIWADNVELSSNQLQKAYDWRIAQWATFGNVVLTAIFGLLSSAVIETFKATIILPDFWSEIGAATLAYSLIYAFCRLRIVTLRQEFMALYTLLEEIK